MAEDGGKSARWLTRTVLIVSAVVGLIILRACVGLDDPFPLPDPQDAGLDAGVADAGGDAAPDAAIRDVLELPDYEHYHGPQRTPECAEAERQQCDYLGSLASQGRISWDMWWYLCVGPGRENFVCPYK